jgi:hypothetical protein
MSAIDKTPTNKNFLSPLNFTFVLKRSPNLNFFVQKINLPSISLDSVNQNSPLLPIPFAAGQISFESLQVSFKVDEDLQNYLEIHNWIRALGFPESNEQYKALSSREKATGEWVKSDITIIISNGLKQPNYDITFYEAFPISISSLDFETTDNDVDYITATTTFKYAYYTITKL